MQNKTKHTTTSLTRRTTLRIVGMHCGACAQRVEAALRGTPGVVDAVVNLMSESASVETASGARSSEAMIAAVRGAGYDAELVSSARELVDRLSSDQEGREQLRRHRQALVQAVGLALPILALDHFRHDLWGHEASSQMACRVMQIVLLMMLFVSPAGAPILAGGLRALRHRTGNMDLLITMGVLTAFVSSLFGAFVLHDEAMVHLHAAAMILGLVCVGRYLEARAKGRAGAAMAALARRAPRTALVRREGRLMSMPAEELVVGDAVSMAMGAAIPVDGVVIEGAAAVDEALMTGEPMPVRRGVGDEVRGGTVVTEGGIVIRATSTGAMSALGRIVQLVAEAQSGRTRMQGLADRVAGVFTPMVVALAAVVFVVWLMVGGWSSLADATRSAVAVLVVACPCALGLATPTVVLVASGAAALRGILVRDAAALESLGGIDLVVWDKTGTLTTGRPTVREIVSARSGAGGRASARDGESSESAETDEAIPEWFAWAASAEQLSAHPLGRAMVEHARRRGLALEEPTEFESTPGLGVRARIGGRDVRVGKAVFLEDAGIAREDLAEIRGAMESRRRAGDTFVAVAMNGAVVGGVLLGDVVRPAARAAVAELRRLGIESEVLTGDEAASARTVAQAVGVRDVQAEASPQDKARHVRELRAGGRRVAMVGDGINDAAALAEADAGIAFATGAEVAGEAAGVNLIGSSPMGVVEAVRLGRRSLRLIRQNLAWAFVYNVFMIPLAAIGRLPPGWAAGAMMISSLTVVLNALRLGRGRS